MIECDAIAGPRKPNFSALARGFKTRMSSSVSFEYELKAIRSKLVRLLDIYASIGQMNVSVSEWYAN